VLAAAVAAGCIWANSSHGASAATGTKKYTGPIEDTRWGPVEAVVYIKGSKITSAKIGVGPENSRSQFIDEQAVPILVQETLKHQTYKIDTVSGATVTSEGYIASLQSVLKKAHFKVKA
jgi:uncharacterized protein with FMN-binding domain